MTAALTLTPEVRAVLEAATVDGNRLTLAGQLDPKLYKQVAKAIELMGGAWKRKERCHVFEDDAEAVVADAIATGSVADLKRAFQFFETPAEVARQLVALADIKPGMTVLEPSAGKGAIIRAIREAGVEPVACELWDKNREALAAMGVKIVATDFLGYSAEPCDRICANPPFTRGQDMQHVLHMFANLKPGGRLVSVMSPGWRFREDRRAREFRAFAESNGAEWHELPEGAFASSGTLVRAGILVVDRRVA